MYYELSKLSGEDARRKLADQAAAGKLTRDETANAVRQRQGRPKPKPRKLRQTLLLESGCRVVVSGSKLRSYYDIEATLHEMLEEVRHRIVKNSRLF